MTPISQSVFQVLVVYYRHPRRYPVFKVYWLQLHVASSLSLAEEFLRTYARDPGIAKMFTLSTSARFLSMSLPQECTVSPNEYMVPMASSLTSGISLQSTKRPVSSKAGPQKGFGSSRVTSWKCWEGTKSSWHM